MFPFLISSRQWKFLSFPKAKSGLPPVVEVRGGVDRLVYNVSTTTSTSTGRSISYLERAAPWRNKARGWGHHPSPTLSTSFVFQLFISLVHLFSAAISQYSHFLQNNDCKIYYFYFHHWIDHLIIVKQKIFFTQSLKYDVVNYVGQMIAHPFLQP